MKVKEMIAIASEDSGEHPSAGRLREMNDYPQLATAYLILVEGGPPSNYSAWSPDLPGCAGVGNTLDECVRDMRSAIAFHLAGIDADGEALPEPTGPGVYVEMRPQAAA